MSVLIERLPKCKQRRIKTMASKPTVPSRKAKPRRIIQLGNEPSENQNESASETAKVAPKRPLQGRRNLKRALENSPPKTPNQSTPSKIDENTAVEENIPTTPSTPTRGKVQKSRLRTTKTTSTGTGEASLISKTSAVGKSSKAVTPKKEKVAKGSTLTESSSSTDETETPTTSTKSILQLKITLKYVSPPIWRRIQVVNTDTFHDLSKYINEAMGWRSYHCHQFISRNKTTKEEISLSNTDMYDDDEDRGKPKEENTKILTFLNSVGDTVLYEYDMGDYWVHSVVVEKTLPFSGRLDDFPKCTGGRRTCPPEDCGGTDGFMNLVQVFNDPSHPEYKELIQDRLNRLYPGWQPNNFKKEQVFIRV